MSFTLLNALDVMDGKTARRISIYQGDLSRIPAEHESDLLVISAFPNDYTPIPGTLMHALHAKGISVGELARDKAYDMRESSAFWLSHPLTERFPAAHVGRIACFETGPAIHPGDMVGALFQGMFPFLDMRSENMVAMPPLASGNQNWPVDVMLRALLDAGTHWLARGLPVKELKIVEFVPERAAELARVMEDFRKTDLNDGVNPNDRDNGGVFLSFRSTDTEAAELIRTTLLREDPGREVFLFQHAIAKGQCWQSEIDEAITSCRSVIALMTPEYFASVECKEELLQARLRHKRADRPVLFPIYWRDWGKELSLWIQLINYVDTREADSARLVSEMQALSPQL